MAVVTVAVDLKIELVTLKVTPLAAEIEINAPVLAEY